MSDFFDSVEHAESMAAIYYGSVMSMLPLGYRMLMFPTVKSLLKEYIRDAQIYREVIFAIESDWQVSETVSKSYNSGGVATVGGGRQSVKVGEFGQDSGSPQSAARRGSVPQFTPSKLKRVLRSEIGDERVAEALNESPRKTWAQVIAEGRDGAQSLLIGMLLYMVMMYVKVPDGMILLFRYPVSHYVQSSMFAAVRNPRYSVAQRFIITAGVALVLIAVFISCAAAIDGTIEKQDAFNAERRGRSAIGGTAVLEYLGWYDAIKQSTATVVEYTGLRPSEIPEGLRNASAVLNEYNINVPLINSIVAVNDYAAQRGLSVRDVELEFAQGGVAQGLLNLEEYYRRGAAVILAHAATGLLNGFAETSLMLKALSGVRNTYNEMARKVTTPINAALDTRIGRVVQGAYNLANRSQFVRNMVRTVMASVIIAYVWQIIMAYANPLGQDNKKKPKQQSKYHRLVSAEMLKYKTKAKSAEERQQRLARAARAASKKLKK